MGKKKKFIDKKKSATFQLLARDSSDPYYNDEPGSDRVFVRVDNNADYSVDNFSGEASSGANLSAEDPNSIFADAPDDVDDGGDAYVLGSSLRVVEEGYGGAAYAVPLPEHVRREILELGFPDDGYNYLTHLREIKNTGGGSAFYHNPKARLDQLPHDVKAYDASRVRVAKEKNDDANYKSMYNVASKTVGVRVQKAVDPDVAALLDDSDMSRFGSDVEDLEEDFVVRANLPKEGEDEGSDEELELVGGSEVINGATDGCAASGDGENEGKHSVVEKAGSSMRMAGDDFAIEKPRTRRLLDEQFDLLESQEYGTDDEDDDYMGYPAEEDEYLADKLKHALNDSAVDDLEPDEKFEAPADVLRRCAEYAKKYENEDEHGDVVILQESSDESEIWDCETIVSTYSNLDNHPGKIGAPDATRKKKLAGTLSGALNTSDPVINLRGKQQLPVDFLPHGRKSTTEKVKSGPGIKIEQLKRKQHGQESKEEKKERKAAVKEEKREARRVKKETKELYRCEAQRAQRVAAVTGPSSIHLQ